jgi:YggT family protein
MTLFQNFFSAIATVINLVLQLYMWIVIGRAVISWVNPDPRNAAVQFLYRTTEPALARIRRYLPPMQGIDLSPFVLILAIIFLQRFLVPTLMQLSGTPAYLPQ